MRKVIDGNTTFDAVVSKAGVGRPPHYDKPMKQTAVWLPDDMIAWLKSQPGTMGETIRDLIKRAMENGSENS